MADNLNRSNDSVCELFDSYPYVIVATVNAVSAMVSALCCIFVIALIFFFKKHIFFVQRIILYHCLVSLFLAFSTMLRIHRLGYQSENQAALNVVCVISGFMSQVTFWMLLMDYSVITITLLMIAVFHKSIARLEGLLVFLIFFLPLTFNWIPFINNSFGRLGPWCSIRNLNFNDCSEFGFGQTLRNVLSNYPNLIFIVIAVPILIVIIVYLVYEKYCKRGRNVAERERRNQEEGVWSLFFFPFGVLLLNIAPVINRIYILVNSTSSPSYALWIIHALFTPLQGGYIALVYTLDRRTLKRLSYSNMMATLCRREDAVQDYPIQLSHKSRETVIRRDGYETRYKKYEESDEKREFEGTDEKV